MVHLGWILLTASVAVPTTLSFNPDDARKPGAVGLRDTVRQSLSRALHDDDTLLGSQDSASGRTGNETIKEPLRCIEVHHPVLAEHGPVVDDDNFGNTTKVDGIPQSCQIPLMKHSFANSYGNPFVAQYQPPECPFNRVVLKLDVVSEGRQFDRLGIIYLGDVEIWRTSTAEPTKHPGIVWTYTKDFTPYLSLWQKQQTLIFDLGNLINEKYTGAFNATLTAHFFDSDVEDPKGSPADLILPVSARKGAQSQPSAFIYPETNATTKLTLPKNVRRATMSVAAVGQGAEEFWWSNVPEDYADYFQLEAGPLPGLSSFREVQVRIDGHIAGLAWPFPVVFTGGIAPPLHRPLVGTQAFDLHEDEVDVTPFLGLLCDGEEHEFSLDVYGVNVTSNKPELVVVPMHWVLTGKVFLWLDDDDAFATTGSVPEVAISPLTYTAGGIPEADGNLRLFQVVERQLRVSAKIQTQHARAVRSWRQASQMSVDGLLANQGDFQVVDGEYAHQNAANVDDHESFSTDAVYTIASDSKYIEPDGDYDFSLSAKLTQRVDQRMTGEHVFPTGLEPFVDQLQSTPMAGTLLRTWREANAFFYSINDGNSSSGFGDANQKYLLSAASSSKDRHVPQQSWPLYVREIGISNETTLHDKQYVLGKGQLRI